MLTLFNIIKTYYLFFYCETEETISSPEPEEVFCELSFCNETSGLFFKASRAKKRDRTTCFSTFFFHTFFLIFVLDFEVRFCKPKAYYCI